ncbi:hypothetical protein LNI95_12045 [Tenacibaculum dicentrarchi]|nr:hypothetical protein [Tenacibaculum dicentrarchi]WCC44007.1 hypothetical protein PJW08_09330 [Tenacibaculum finnmarkense]
MLDLSNLFSGIDNIYKFLTIGGLIMFCTAMIYPLQKKQILKLEINTNQKERVLLENEKKNLEIEIKKLSFEADKIIIILKKNDSLKQKSNNQSIKKDFKKKYQVLKSKEKEIEIKDIVIEYNHKKIEILEENIKEYESYILYLKVPGIIFSFLGLFFWIRSTSRSEKLKKKELKKIE